MEKIDLDGMGGNEDEMIYITMDESMQIEIANIVSLREDRRF